MVSVSVRPRVVVAQPDEERVKAAKTDAKAQALVHGINRERQAGGCRTCPQLTMLCLVLINPPR
jgi:hypothetical protein